MPQSKRPPSRTSSIASVARLRAPPKAPAGRRNKIVRHSVTSAPLAPISASRATGLVGLRIAPLPLRERAPPRGNTLTALHVRGKQPRHPPETIAALATGYVVAQLLYVVAKLGIADVLAAGPLRPEVIAARVGAHPPYLRRILRTAASVGVFAEDSSGRFRHTAVSEGFRKDSPKLARNVCLTTDIFYAAFAAMEHTVLTGGSAFEHVFHQSLFEYLQQHPEKGQVFAEGMSATSVEQSAAVCEAYRFGDFSSIVDVGGSHGHLLAAILQRHRSISGVLFDRPEVLAGAAGGGFISEAASAGRCRMIGGDFFHSVPQGADLYVLKQVIHDWGDEASARILRNCRDAMAREGRVLVVDRVIASGNRPDHGKVMDIAMMVITPGGQERDRVEFRDLFAAAGLRLTRVIPTASPLSIVEGVRA